MPTCRMTVFLALLPQAPGRLVFRRRPADFTLVNKLQQVVWVCHIVLLYIVILHLMTDKPTGFQIMHDEIKSCVHSNSIVQKPQQGLVL